MDLFSRARSPTWMQHSFSRSVFFSLCLASFGASSKKEYFLRGCTDKLLLSIASSPWNLSPRSSRRIYIPSEENCNIWFARKIIQISLILSFIIMQLIKQIRLCIYGEVYLNVNKFLQTWDINVKRKRRQLPTLAWQPQGLLIRRDSVELPCSLTRATNQASHQPSSNQPPLAVGTKHQPRDSDWKRGTEGRISSNKQRKNNQHKTTKTTPGFEFKAFWG